MSLLFYLDDICVFSSSVDEMLNRVGLVLSHLKEFNLKIKLKKIYFLQKSMFFQGMFLARMESLQIRRR